MRILVTGATDGIGQQTAVELARRGADVVVHGRAPERVEVTRRRVARETGREPEGLIADLSSLAAVRHLAAAVGAVDVLVNNAGVWRPDRHLTEDGFEWTFAVNHLAPFLLTHLLLPGMPATGRVVHVSSGVHVRARLDEASFTGGGRYDGHAAYAQSKLAQVLFSAELTRRLPHGPASNALHPGVVGTKMLREAFSMSGSESLTEGAQTSVFLAISPEAADLRGAYLAVMRKAATSPLVRDADLVRRFYAASAEMVGIDGLPEPD